MDYTRAVTISQEELDEVFTFHPWSGEQIAAGRVVRDQLAGAFAAIVNNAPPSPLRTRALNAVVDARMLANAAITFKGKY
jgi:hypothetical protein